MGRRTHFTDDDALWSFLQHRILEIAGLSAIVALAALGFRNGRLLLGVQGQKARDRAVTIGIGIFCPIFAMQLIWRILRFLAIPAQERGSLWTFVSPHVLEYAIVSVSIALVGATLFLLIRGGVTEPIPRLWLEVFGVGSAFYLGLWLLGIFGSLLFGVLAVAAIASGIAVLVAMDQSATRGTAEPGQMSFARLGYVLLVERRSLFALLLLMGVTAVGVVLYYVAVSVFTIEFSGDQGLVVKLPGQTVYYYPIHPYVGWQRTGIRLEKGQEFSYSISGRVSTGFLTDIHERSRKAQAVYKCCDGRPDCNIRRECKDSVDMPRHPWPFTEPSGHHEWEYPERDKPPVEGKTLPTRHYANDTGLTVQGLPHNTVVGIIRDESYAGAPRSANSDSDPKKRRPGYHVKATDDEQAGLLVLSHESYPQRARANASGELWVVINDVDVFRWDNAGFFFLRLTTGRAPIGEARLAR